jgi:hypothetical protein
MKMSCPGGGLFKSSMIHFRCLYQVIFASFSGRSLALYGPICSPFNLARVPQRNSYPVFPKVALPFS